MNKDESEFFITEFPKEGCYLNRSASRKSPVYDFRSNQTHENTWHEK